MVTEIRSRLEFLEEVGLGYLTLDRAAPTLSGGEAQRIRLAAQLGSNLQGVCYVLDEPTIGLHPRDNRILLDALPSSATRATRWWSSSTTRTRSARADHIIDIGPGAGKRGGRVVAQGSVADAVGAAPIRSPAASWRSRWRTRCRRAAPVSDGERRRALTAARRATLHNLRDARRRACRCSAWSP